MIDGNWALPAARWIAVVVIAAGLLQVLNYIVQLLFAAVALARRPPLPKASNLWGRYADEAPAISVLATAYNEELTILDSVSSLLSLQYPDFEVIVINDGSGDRTLQTMVDHYGLSPVARYYDLAVSHAPIRGLYASPRLPRLLIVDKINGGGKADALNAGINVSRAPLFCAVDADSLLEPDALLRAVRPFIEQPDKTIGVGGTIRIANGSRIRAGQVQDVALPTNFLALVQTVEYLRAYLMARIALSAMQVLTVISGAFGLFNRKAVIEVGGYSTDTVGEDMELLIKLHKLCRDRGQAYRIDFIPEPVCWTEVPEELGSLGRQRARWQRGALETFFRHWRMAFNPRYGRIGFVAFGQLLVVDVIGPVVEVLGYLLVPLLWGLGLLSLDHLLGWLSVIFTFGIFLSVATLILEEVELRRFARAGDLAILTLIAVIENFGYRQLSNIWRIQGWWQFLRGEHGWGKMTRKGFQTS